MYGEEIPLTVQITPHNSAHILGFHNHMVLVFGAGSVLGSVNLCAFQRTCPHSHRSKLNQSFQHRHLGWYFLRTQPLPTRLFHIQLCFTVAAFEILLKHGNAQISTKHFVSSEDHLTTIFNIDLVFTLPCLSRISQFLFNGRRQLTLL